MRRLLYKFFSGDYLHVVSLIASHYRARRIRASLCYAPGCKEHGVVWLDQAGIFCWDHYAEQMRAYRLSSNKRGTE